MAAARRVALVAVLVAAPFLLLGLGAAPFDDPGEGMHAEIARELHVSRDPLALSLSGVRYVDKPPLLYVLLAVAFGIGGEREATARAVPALAALAAVGVTAWLGARLLGGRGGLLAGGALLGSAGFFAYGRYVRPDALFVAAIAWGFALVLQGVAGDRRSFVVIGLACFGLAGLAKDPLGVIAPPLAIGLALALAGRARPIGRWLPPAGVFAAAGPVLVWWALAEVWTPGFTWYTVVDNHILNIARARYFPDGDVPLSGPEFLLIAALGSAPWIIAAGVATAGMVRRRAWRDPSETPWVALAVWAAGVLGLTALSPFRLPHYGLPAYPAVALLAARAWCEGPRRALVVVHAVAFAALATACAVAWSGDGASFVRLVMGATDVATRKAELGGQAPMLPPWATMRPLLGTTGVVAGAAALALVVAAVRRATAAAAVVTLACMLALMPAVGAALALVSAHRAVRGLATELARRAGAADIVAHEGPLEDSGALEWYSGRRPLIVDGRRSVLAFGATLDGGAPAFWRTARLREAWQGDRRIWLVTTRDPEHTVATSLVSARLAASDGGRWLYVNR